MNINEANYTASYPSFNICPPNDLPEYAFIGRSNVGKSSLINMLCGRKELAHTSKKPGKTQMLNYFLIDNTWNIVDLPGYGYAIISKKMRRKWKRMIEEYLMRREQLQSAFILIDANVPPQKIDIEFINRLGEMGVPFVIVYTKTDRLKEEELSKNVSNFQNALLETWEELPQQFITSSIGRKGRKGRKEILDFIESTNESFNN